MLYIYPIYQRVASVRTATFPISVASRPAEIPRGDSRGLSLSLYTPNGRENAIPPDAFIVRHGTKRGATSKTSFGGESSPAVVHSDINPLRILINPSLPPPPPFQSFPLAARERHRRVRYEDCAIVPNARVRGSNYARI